MNALVPPGSHAISTGESFPMRTVSTICRLDVLTSVSVFDEKSEVIASVPSGVSSTPFGHAPLLRIATSERPTGSTGTGGTVAADFALPSRRGGAAAF
jgi:hypothetical protein